MSGGTGAEARPGDGGSIDSPSKPLLELANITKRFPGVLALDDVSFELRPGEVHAVFGENGAGKSTLTHIIAGTYSADEGTVRRNDAEVHWHSPTAARSAGVAAVFQELSLVPTFNVADNVFLGHEERAGARLADKHMAEVTRTVLERLGHDNIDPRTRVSELSRSERQVVEIAKALRGDAEVLILDEPTVALTDTETDRLFEIIDGLRAAGTGVIYITHRVNELDRLADRVTVLRDGRWVGTYPWGTLDHDGLIELMTGREVRQLYPGKDRTPGGVRLEVENLTTKDEKVRDVSLTVRAGEVVGIAGLMGAGKSELAQACFGVQPIESGAVKVDGKEMRRIDPSKALASGLVYCPGDRHRDGLIAALPVSQNMSLSRIRMGGFQRFPFLRRRKERQEAQRVAERLQLRPLDISRPVGLFSGGNQQKVVLARGLMNDVSVAILEEPTAGVDVGARAELYELIAEFCEEGVGVLVISSDLPEVLGLCQRVYVMREGRIRAELSTEELTEEQALQGFF
jgi:ribose transport system ATP-binding protein